VTDRVTLADGVTLNDAVALWLALGEMELVCRATTKMMGTERGHGSEGRLGRSGEAGFGG
jgi:hypothetical protein